jgi:hypothetical protein
MRPQRFRNRTDAGRRLAEKLAAYADRPDVLVLALPRGGVPVGYESSREVPCGPPLSHHRAYGSRTTAVSLRV